MEYYGKWELVFVMIKMVTKTCKRNHFVKGR
jgi:hypothetical protein